MGTAAGRDRESRDEAPRGFRYGAGASGMRFTGRDDLALIACDGPAAWSGVFTTSSAAGAPVVLARRLLSAGGPLRAVLVNAGVANAGTGRAGLADARRAARLAAQALDVRPEEVLCASTGWVGERVDVGCLAAALPAVLADLAPGGSERVARAILTSDSVPKRVSARCRVDGRQVRLLGVAKGSGMVAPSMATLLAFVTTDAACRPGFLRSLWRDVVGESFNALSIDGETSPSDMAVVLASGAAGNRPLSRRHPDAPAFGAALREVAVELVRRLARDGEGAKKLVVLTVTGARSRGDARRAAAALARSPMVRTAVAGASPAWGRFVAALGASGVPFAVERFGLAAGDAWLVQGGRHQGAAAEAEVRRRLAAEEVHLTVALGRGPGRFTAYTCDLTPDYCAENLDPPLPAPRD
ncbi:MAG: bifunctional glutamate N-acetyltransferase/amino-acid acetyltransferase ArgJ [Thermoanaerobaculia bacterium]